MPESALARLLGLDKQNLTNTLTTLLSFGVASRDPDTGALVSRRMVRDEERRTAAKAHGATGGNPKLTIGYNSPGFIYAARDPETGHVKIGIATNYKLRIKKIGYKAGRQMETLWGLPVDDMGTKERQIHSAFEKFRVRGEWFDFPDTFVTTLKGEVMGILGGTGKGETRVSISSSSSISSSEEEKSNHRIASFDEVKAFAKSAPIPIADSCAEAFFDEMETLGWTHRGIPIADWRARFRRFATNWNQNEQGRAFR